MNDIVPLMSVSVYHPAGDGLPILLDNVGCEGTEVSLANCGISWETVGSDCTHSQDAGVVCTDGQLLREICG